MVDVPALVADARHEGGLDLALFLSDPFRQQRWRQLAAAVSRRFGPLGAESGLVVAPDGGGKTTLLWQYAVNAACLGKQVRRHPCRRVC